MRVEACIVRYIVRYDAVIDSMFNDCFVGKVFTWGDNKYGQLGLGDKRRRLTPMIVKTRLSETEPGNF